MPFSLMIRDAKVMRGYDVVVAAIREETEIAALKPDPRPLGRFV